MCWPNSETMDSVEIRHEADLGERAFIVYEAVSGNKRFRNCEMHTARAGRLASVEVYFGWNLPHPVAIGRHRKELP